MMTVSRNQPCPCNSGKKYKKCCGLKAPESIPSEIVGERALALGRQGYNHLTAGDYRKAIVAFREALALKKDLPEIHFNLGAAYKKAGQAEEAAQSYREALRYNPGFVQAHNNLGNILLDQAQLPEAISCFQKALAGKPDFVEALNNLGTALNRMGQTEEALGYFNRALAYNPAYPQAYLNLANIMHDKGRYEEAIACLKKAVSIVPDYLDALNNLGTFLRQEGRQEEALAFLQQAVAANPRYGAGYCNLGNVQRELGLMEEAKSSFRNSLSLNPKLGLAHLGLSYIHKYKSGDAHLAEMEKLFADPSLPDEQRMYLAFALGKAAEEAGEYEKGFEFLRLGNTLKRSTYHYDPEESVATFDKLKAVFTPDFIRENAAGGNPDPTPIFILGMPRSATSLTEQILASHPEVYGGGELDFLFRIIYQASGGGNLDSYLDLLPKEPAGSLSALGNFYLKQLRSLADREKHITDKMPHNFLLIGLIGLALPRARIIHCLRDPLDTCLSIYKNYFAGEHRYAYDLQELGQYYNLYRALMRHWHQLFPGKIYDIGYENLIADQEGETRKLLDYCGLPWDEACLSFHRTARKVGTASAVQVRRPIYKDSLKLWQRYSEQLQPLQEILAAPP